MKENSAPRFVSAAEITRNFGLWQDRAAQGPLLVTHHGRPRCVLLTVEDYQAMAGTPSPMGDMQARHEIEHGLLTERIEGGFVTLDPQGLVGEVSTLGALLLGKPEAQLAGRPIAEAAVGFGTGLAAAGLRRVTRTGEEAQFDLQADGAAGHWLRVRAFPWPDGMALILRSIDDEAENDRVGAEAAALARARASHGGIAVARLTVRATIAVAEPGFASLAGFATERLTGVRLIDLLALSARPAAGAAIERVLGGGGVESFDSRLLVNSGTERPVRIAIAALAEGFAVSGAMLTMTMF
jgi:PAS domain-containing protein